MSASRSKAVAAFVGAVAFLVALAGAITGYALADKPPAAKPPAVPRAASAVAFRQAAVSAEDLVEMTGLNVYKFQLEVPRGQRFRVALSRWAAEGSPAKVVWHYDFEREAGGPLVLRVAFLRRDGKLQGVLLDGEAEAGFRLDCEGCRPGGLATIVKNPLADVPPTERMLLVLPSEKAWGHSKAGPTRLLAVARTKPGVSLGDLEGAYPRAELTVERLPNAD